MHTRSDCPIACFPGCSLSNATGTSHVRVRSCRKGCRDRILLNSILDAGDHCDEALKALCKRRWNVETDLRSLKDSLQAGILSCQTPAMIMKEPGAHLPRYNLLRLVMGEAAAMAGRDPHSVSFSHALQLCMALPNHDAPAGRAPKGAKAIVCSEFAAATRCCESTADFAGLRPASFRSRSVPRTATDRARATARTMFCRHVRRNRSNSAV